MLYVPLKTSVGEPVGSLSITDDVAMLKTKRPMPGKCFVVTDEQTLPIFANTPLKLVGTFRAVAVVDDDRLTCHGVAPNCNLTRQQLWSLLSQNRTKSVVIPEPELEQVDEPEPDDGAIMSQQSEPYAHPDVHDTEAATASFSALLHRANAVYERIDTQHQPMHHPALTEPLAVPAPAPAPKPPNVSSANDWLNEIDTLLKGAKATTVPPSVVGNPFPNTFPNSTWTAVSGEGVMPHLEGEWKRGSELFKIIAVPGAYAPRPPKHLFGFTRFIRTRQGGYWIKLLDR